MSSSDLCGLTRDGALASYCDYLLAERGLAVTTVGNYRDVAAAFLAQIPEPFTESLRGLSAGQVLEIVHGRGLERPSARTMVSSLRVLLRFLFASGMVEAPLAFVVPRAARWRLSTLPARLTPAVVTALLGGGDRGTVLGRRNYAVMLLLARLGLRAREVARLALDDIDWRAGVITVRGKGGRLDQLPLPRDVGQALTDYLCTRPAGCGVRVVFLAVNSPPRGIGRQAVGSAVRRACALAGVDEVGPHRLRHTLAENLLAAGASLPEVGQLLRLCDLQTTSIYAKVNRRALAELARPWPVTAPRTAAAAQAGVGS